MEVMIPSPTPSRSSSPSKDTFNFISGTMSSPYLSAPSSPKRFGEYYLSAPSSPSRISQLYSELDYFSSTIEASSTNNRNNDDDDDDEGGFAFFVGRELDHKLSPRSAEELFDGGKIKPLKPQTNELVSKNESRSSGGGEERRRGRERERERERTTETVLSSANNSGRRIARSHSPYRKSNHTWELLEEQNSQQQRQQQQQPPRSIKEETTSSKSSRRWSLNLKDFLLFRSASEGRGSSKDPLKKFVGYKKSSEQDVIKGTSFRSSDNNNNSLRKKGPVSAHEFHYAMKKAESQDMKKRTFLPYRQGILGRLSGFGL